MSTTYGAPTNLDLSACSVTATGGTTSQTLADLGKAVSDSTTAVATAQSDATDAKTAAGNALETVQTAVSACVQTSSVGVAGGVAGLNSVGDVIIYHGGWGNTGAGGNTSYLCLGNYMDNNKTAGAQYGAIQFGNGGNTSRIVTINTWNDGEGNKLSFDGNTLHPAFDNTSNLGLADHAWSNVYSKTAVQVTSDITQKTVIGSLGDASYSDGQKLAAALFGLDTSMFQLNASIAEKGADAARLHAGFIAQQVQAAITAAGLDPSKFALWTNSPVVEIVNKPTGEKDDNGNDIMVPTGVPVTNADGSQKYTQMLRYDQILCVLFEAAKSKIAAQENALSALATRVAALESKAGA